MKLQKVKTDIGVKIESDITRNRLLLLQILRVILNLGSGGFREGIEKAKTRSGSDLSFGSRNPVYQLCFSGPIGSIWVCPEHELYGPLL